MKINYSSCERMYSIFLLPTTSFVKVTFRFLEWRSLKFWKGHLWVQTRSLGRTWKWHHNTLLEPQGQAFRNGCFKMISNLYIGNAWKSPIPSIENWLFGVPGCFSVYSNLGSHKAPLGHGIACCDRCMIWRIEALSQIANSNHDSKSNIYIYIVTL